MPKPPQNYKNHARYDVLYHVILFVILFANFIYSIVFYVQHMHTTPSSHFQNGWLIIMAFALLLMFTKLRSYPLKVQDRVIRIEEQMRLHALGVPRETIAKLTMDQFIGLRFAPDQKLPSLAADAAKNGLTRDQIKKKINSWRPDEFRV